MRKDGILLIYKSTTGFTERYARMIVEETGCELIRLKGATPERMAGFDTVIFGTRLHAGSVDGLKRARALIKKSGIKRVILFATGAMPAEATAEIDKVWEDNLSPSERKHIPHFYMPGGLCYEKMPLVDRLMMKAVPVMLKHKKNKTDSDRELEQAIRHSYDISSKEYIKPLIESCGVAGGSCQQEWTAPRTSKRCD